MRMHIKSMKARDAEHNKKTEEQQNKPIVKPISQNTPEKAEESKSSRNNNSFQRRPPRLSKEEAERLLKENDLRTMREAGIDEADIPFSEIIYNTDTGYGGELITYHRQKRQFYLMSSCGI